MAEPRHEARLASVVRLTAAIGVEIAHRDPAAPVPWPELPNVASMVAHVGGIQRWVTAIVRTRTAVDRDAPAVPAGADLGAWFEEGRTDLLDVLAATDPDAPCWVIGGSIGTAGFWRRRMVFEHAKHLMDLRASGTATWSAAPELGADDYADGIDELLAVYLPRSRPHLPPLPAPVLLLPDDCDRGFRIERDWTVAAAGPERSDVDTAVAAPASDLALALWERADLRDRSRFRVAGDPAAVDALASARIHPW